MNTTNTATNSNRFNESLTYDIRGNINALQRQGYYASTCGFDQIDNLTYTYTPNTNRIASIADNAPLSQRSHGFNPGSGGVGYTYDANGNLKSDSYKGISTIFYNHLNLPSLINFTSGNSIEYKYDAGGNKLRKTVKVGAVVQYEQYYVGGVEYRKTGTGNTRIEAIYHSEGRYANIDLDIDDSPNWRKEYNIKDHLGNTRLSFADKNGNGVIDITTTPATNDILQENHYYPFGLSYEGPWLMNDAARDNGYKYNGKELNEDFGLNWYDYGARFYDPAIGRWGHVDPHAERYPDISPYAYVANNPIIYIDPDGRDLILSFATAGAMTSYTNIVNSALGGKYQANLVAIAGTSNYRVEITTINSKAKINSEQKAFYKNLNKVVTAKEVVNQSVVENDANVVVDSWQTNQIDIKDVEAFDAAGIGAASSAGALTHSHIEQLEKAKKGLGAGVLGATKTDASGNKTYTDYEKSHNKAIKSENKVNGNTRGVNGNQDLFKEKDGTVTNQTLTPNASGGMMEISPLQPRNTWVRSESRKSK